ncbi:unnamed protein product [Linum trigynum]|uniref:DUF4283 domain-containing protein n=1 Tax=Linum trigynum TaxID=586398 RepID=A0AAV2FT35_9ROSI
MVVVADRSWASLFHVAEENRLEYYELEFVNGSLRIPKLVIEEGAKHWDNSLVGQFLVDPPSISALRFWANWIWGKEGEVKVSMLEDRLVLFQFPSESTCRWVFEGGPWHYKEKIICLRRWVPGIRALEINNSAIPVWVNLTGIPAELALREGLGRIASSIGKPMCMDHSISHRRKIGAVKVCVEVSAKKPLVNRISITPDDMEEMYIGVEYCGLPRCCSACGVFGHDCSMPPLGASTKRVSRPKKLQVTSIQEGNEVSNQAVGEKEPVKEGMIIENAGEGVSEKGKEVIVDSTPPVTPSALPSQKEFNKVINGAKSRSIPRNSAPVLHSNAFELLCGRNIKLQAPQKKPGGREGLRSKGATKVAATHR